MDDLTIEEMLKDYKDNERDIRMFQLMIEGNWTNVSSPRLYLTECLKIKSVIEDKLKKAEFNLSELTNQ
jgi:hypothetical protein